MAHLAEVPRERQAQKFEPIDGRSRVMLAGRIRQIDRFVMDALTMMAKGGDLDRVSLRVIEASLSDALAAVREIYLDEHDRPF